MVLTPADHMPQVTLAATTLLLISLAIVFSGNPGGYEVSLYDVLPPGFWITVIATFALYSGALIGASLQRRPQLTATNLAGLTGTYFALLALPIMRYRTYYTEWDVWFHLGDTIRIKATGHVDLIANYYPSFHILWASLAEATGISVFASGLVIGPGLAALSIPVLYVFSKRISGSSTAGAVAAILGAIPFGTVGLSPAPGFYALTLLVIVLFSLVLRRDQPSVATTILAFVMATSLAISHPITPVFAILAIAIATLLSRLIRSIGRLRLTRSPDSSPGVRSEATTLLAYLTVLYITWIGILTVALQGSIERLAFAIQVGGLINSTQYGRFLTPGLILKSYGAMAILSFYWLSGGVLLWKHRRFRSGLGTRIAASVVLGSLLMAVAFQVIASGLGIGLSATIPLTVAFLFLPILGGTFVWTVGIERSTRGVVRAVVALAILVPFVLGAAAFYPSPYISLFNYQNTEQVYASVDWAANYLPDQVEILSNSHIGRYAYFPWQALGGNYQKVYHWENTIPSNLSQFLKTTSSTSYMIVDLQTVQVARMDLRAWDSPSPAGVWALNNWAGSARTYDNGEVQVFMISAYGP